MEDADHLCNPAGRLWLLLRDFSGYPQSEAMTQAVARYFGYPADDLVLYMEAVVAIWAVPNEIRVAVNGLTNPVPPASRLLQPLEAVVPAIRGLAFSNNALTAVMGTIHQGVLSDLETCSYLLNSQRGAKPVPDSTLDELRDLIEALIDALSRDTELSDEFKEGIRRHAQRIADSISLYRVHGAEGIIAEWDGLMGAMARHSSELHRPGPVIPLLKKVGAVVLTIVAAVAAPNEFVTGLEFIIDSTTSPVMIEAPAVPDETQPT
jgi:hypothetical protein